MKLHIGNLPFSVEDNELKELLASYSPSEVTLIKDKFSGRSKGFGFAEIPNDEDAQKAISELNGKDVQGRELKVSEAKPMEDRPPRRSFGGGNRGFGGGSSRGNFNRRY
jgi:RNA recognition motif-containing protein